MRLRKVTMKKGVITQKDWGTIWDTFNAVAGNCRDKNDVWRCFRPGEKPRVNAYVFERVDSFKREPWI